MARRDGDGTGTAVLDRPATGDQTNGTGSAEDVNNAAQQDAGGDTAPAKATKVKRNPEQMGPDELISINVRIPNALRAKVAETAIEQDTSVPQLVAAMLASAYDFELPKPTRAPRTKKYATPEERKEAQKAAQAKQRMLTKAVLGAIERGEIDVDVEALIARIQQEEAAKATAEGATAS